MDAFKTQNRAKCIPLPYVKGHWMKVLWHTKNVQEIKELIEPTVEIIDTIVPLINIKAV